MFKKVIAGIASVSLALGMVALTAGPASAHTPIGRCDRYDRCRSAPSYSRRHQPTGRLRPLRSKTTPTSSTHDEGNTHDDGSITNRR